MAQNFNGKYTMTKELGKFGNKVVEIGHYEMDGKVFDDKVYIFECFTKRNGTEDRRAIAKFTVDEFKALKKIKA